MWCLEQPKGSLFQEHPLIQSFLNVVETFREHINMGDFGAMTQKPTWLYAGLAASCFAKYGLFHNTRFVSA